MEMQILNFSLCVIEYAAFFVFFNSLLDRKFKTIIPLITVILAGAAIMFFSMKLDLAIKSLIGFAILFVGSSALFKGKISIRFSFTFLLLFTVAIIDLIFGNFFALIFNDSLANVFFTDFKYRLISCLVIKAVDIAVLFIIFRLFKRIDNSISSKYWRLFGFIFFALHVSAIIFLKFYIESNQDTDIILMFLFIALAFFVMSLIVVYFFTEICVGVQRDKRLFALETNNRVLEEALAVQKCSEENLRKIKHDITKHTVNAVALIERGNTNEAVVLLKNAGENALKVVPKNNINSGNQVVDAIISSKSAICESKGIIFTYRVDPLDEIKIETTDLSSLLSNLLDNAIGAAQQIENGHIRIEIFKYKAYYGICVENSFMGKGSIVHSGLRLFSTKPNSDMHGYGTQIIEEIAQKYSGHASWNADGEMFIFNVLLKI